MRHRIEWPKIIGGILALESTGLILQQLGWLWSLVSGSGGHVLPIEWFWLAVTVVLSACSYGVYCAHEWARRVVIVLGLFVIAALIVSVVYDAIHELGRVPEFAQEVTPEARAWQIRSVVRGAGGSTLLRRAVDTSYRCISSSRCCTIISRPHHKCDLTRRSSEFRKLAESLSLFSLGVIAYDHSTTSSFRVDTAIAGYLCSSHVELRVWAG